MNNNPIESFNGNAMRHREKAMRCSRMKISRY